jgi:bifunctional ADP-heptose synthase (sugar kinase/adenylyltransferase)
MKRFQQMSIVRLGELVAKFPSARIAVIGDFFLDKYMDVEPSLGEPSVETGKVAHQVVAIRRSPGVGGTVISNLAALGARDLHAIGITGDDGEAYDLRRGLNALGCSTQHLHQAPDRMTCLYLKPHDRTDVSLAGQHSRYDVKNRVPPTPEIQQKVMESLNELLPSLDAVIVADQAEERDCGVITGFVRDGLAIAARAFPDVVFWADSRRRIREFHGLMIKVNQYEAVGHDNPLPGTELSDEEVLTAIAILQREAAAPVFVTRGSVGMVVGAEDVTLVPGVQVDGPIDPTGAGDSATAGAVLALCAGALPTEAALLGNLVASITVQQLAVTGVARPAQLAPRLALWRQQQDLAAAH